MQVKNYNNQGIKESDDDCIYKAIKVSISWLH